jgi:hypothetical protein
MLSTSASCSVVQRSSTRKKREDKNEGTCCRSRSSGSNWDLLSLEAMVTTMDYPYKAANHVIPGSVSATNTCSRSSFTSSTTTDITHVTAYVATQTRTATEHPPSNVLDQSHLSFHNHIAEDVNMGTDSSNVRQLCTEMLKDLEKDSTLFSHEPRLVAVFQPEGTVLTRR